MSFGMHKLSIILDKGSGSVLHLKNQDTYIVNSKGGKRDDENLWKTGI